MSVDEIMGEIISFSPIGGVYSIIDGAIKGNKVEMWMGIGFEVANLAIGVSVGIGQKISEGAEKEAQTISTMPDEKVGFPLGSEDSRMTQSTADNSLNHEDNLSKLVFDYEEDIPYDYLKSVAEEQGAKDTSRGWNSMPDGGDKNIYHQAVLAPIDESVREPFDSVTEYLGSHLMKLKDQGSEYKYIINSPEKHIIEAPQRKIVDADNGDRLVDSLKNFVYKQAVIFNPKTKQVKLFLTFRRV